MKKEKRDSKRWILLVLLVLLLILLLAFCSRRKSAGTPQEQGQPQPAVEQPTEIILVDPEPTAPPTAESCPLDHPFFPIRLGAIWTYRTHSTTGGREYGPWSGGRVDEVVEVSDTQAMIFGYTLVGNLAGPENWHQEFEIRCIDEYLWGLPSIVYVLPRVLSPNSSYHWPVDSTDPVEYQVGDWGTVTVPAGTFEVLCISFSDPYETRSHYVTSGVSCFAEGVGLVYDENHTSIPDENGEVSAGFSELESYTIPTE